MPLHFHVTPSGASLPSSAAALSFWHVLIVDDDPSVLGMTDLILRNAIIEGRKLRIHAARDACEARRLLTEIPDVAVAIIDLVLQGDESGLDLVRYIRKTLGNQSMRVVLHTARPTLAPERQALAEFEVNAYLDKASTNAARIHSTLLTWIRSYSEVVRLQSAIGRLEVMASTDPLTGLRNTSTLGTAYDQAIGFASRRMEPLTLMFLDIDGFKRINDDRGHLLGDEILRRVAAGIRAQSREADLCFRYGGDEFILILPGCSQEQAVSHYLPRLSGCFEALGVTLSIGLCDTWPPRYASMEEMLARADAKMYEVKRARRPDAPALR